MGIPGDTTLLFVGAKKSQNQPNNFVRISIASPISGKQQKAMWWNARMANIATQAVFMVSAHEIKG